MATSKPPRHFLSLLDLSPDELRGVVRRATELKAIQHRHDRHDSLRGRVLGMIFEKSSTRTRVSFEAGMAQLGGHAMFLAPKDTQLGRGEPMEDTARVLSRMVDAIMVRTYDHGTVECFARYSGVPVINGLTDRLHPCQLLADMQTYGERRGDIAGRCVAWLGDGNNMCNSYINAARQFDFELRIACPEGFEPDAELLAANRDRCRIERDPAIACSGADLISTDVWASMGQESEQESRKTVFAPFQVTAELMSLANDGALFLHCLPAHRGEEVAAEVLDHPDTAVWEQAENRLHAQKALLEFLLL